MLLSTVAPPPWCLQDQRDALLGRVFGLAALARSGLAIACPAAAHAPSEGADADKQSLAALSCVAVVAEQLVALLQRKSFLRESAAAAVVDLLQSLTVEEMQQVRQGGRSG